LPKERFPRFAPSYPYLAGQFVQRRGASTPGLTTDSRMPSQWLGRGWRRHEDRMNRIKTCGGSCPWNPISSRAIAMAKAYSTGRFEAKLRCTHTDTAPSLFMPRRTSARGISRSACAGFRPGSFCAGEGAWGWPPRTRPHRCTPARARG